MLVLGGIFLASAAGLYYAAWVFWQDERVRGHVRHDDGRTTDAILFSVGSFLAAAGVFLIWCGIRPARLE